MTDNQYRIIIALAIVCLCLIGYYETLSYQEFLFDGPLFLLHNPLVQDLDYYAKLFDIGEFSGLDEQLNLDSDVVTNFMTRPLTYFTFSLNHLLHGFNAQAFRAVNIVIHILNSLLVFACVERLLGVSKDRKPLRLFSLRFIPAVTALIFLSHPLQTESVTYITQRFACLAALFYLTTIWLYLGWSAKKKEGTPAPWVRWITVIVLLLGMLTRESLFTAPILILGMEIVVVGNTLKTGMKRAAHLLLLLPVIPILVIMVSASQATSTPSLNKAINVVNYADTPILDYALTQVVVVVAYLRMLLLPYGQNVDHDHQVFTSPFHLPVMGAGAMILLLLGGAYILHSRNRDDIRYALVFVGVCWYFIGLSVSSSFVPLPDVMVEHRVYFPSIGIIMSLICLIDIGRESIGSSTTTRLIVFGIVCWCITLTVLTHIRNHRWQSGIHLWSDAVRKSPDKHRAWYNLGVSHVKAGNDAKAVHYLEKSIEMEPEWSQCYELLGIVYLNLKRPEDAAKVAIKGISINPANPINYNNLGVAYIDLRRIDDAKQAFSTAAALFPGYKDAIYNLDKIDSFFEVSDKQDSPH